jgi:hypothetical protein
MAESNIATNRENPLLQRTINRISAWDEWRQRFDNPNASFEELMGLLHTGLGRAGSRVDNPKAVCFYLEIAYGWVNSNYFTKRNPSDKLGSGEIRWELAKKAFKVLCERFFKDEGNLLGEPWTLSVVDPVVFAKLLWFFSPRGVNLRNLEFSRQTSYEYQVLEKFLRRFLQFVWRFDGSFQGSQRSFAMRERFHDARPEILEIMNELGWIMMILEPRETSASNKQIFDLDDISMEKLSELAMLKHPWARAEVHKHESIEAAVHAGVQAAMVYVTVLSGQKEAQRRLEIEKLQQERAELDKKLERLK